jgi:hypothetical protein
MSLQLLTVLLPSKGGAQTQMVMPPLPIRFRIAPTHNLE